MVTHTVYAKTYRAVIILFAAAVSICFLGAEARAFAFVKDGLPSCFIVVGPDASLGERYAAKELAGYLEQMTGVLLPVRDGKYSELPETAKAVLIGQGDWTRNPRFKGSIDDLGALGDQGFVIRSYEDKKPEVLLVTGGKVRGTIYAANTILHQLGVRWYTKDVTVVPKRKTVDIGSVSVTDLPCFDIRDVISPEPDMSWEWKAHLRLTVGYGYLEQLTGIAPIFAPLECTIPDLLPSSLIRDASDIFPLVEGKRVGSLPNRCLTSPDAVTIAVDSLAARLRKNPGTITVIIDCGNGEGGVCSCDDCRRLRTAHKAESALIVDWAGKVAERLEKLQPGVFIVVKLGNTYEKPPAGMHVSDRIAIALSPETVDQKTPYESSIDEGTMAFLAHLTGWRELPARVIAMHPSGNHLVPAAPFPDVAQLFNSIELYHYNMVEGCVIRFPGVDGVRTPFAELRTWMAAELMWDHYQDTDILVREWMKGVYGNARGPMNDYWKHVKKLAMQPNIRIAVRTEPFEYITDTWLAEADRMLTRAYAISMTDSMARNYVRRERFGLRTVQLYRALSKTPSNKESCRAMITSWLEEAKMLGYDRVSAEMTCRELADKVAASLKK